jgi:formate-dependent nitrite reductase membrane component NrfD
MNRAEDPPVDRNAVTGRHGRRRKGEQPMVPDAEFTSYYGRPIINRPVWKTPDVPGYLFLGGLAGGASLLGLGAHLTQRPVLARTTKTAAAGSAGLSTVALVHDLGRPERFLNMLRVFKVTSPMSVGSWLLSAFGGLSAASAACEWTGWMPRIGTAATAGTALVGPGLAAYTAALITDTAVPAWHDGYREMPFVFTGSGAAAAGGLGMLAAPVAESAPARTFAVLGAATELAATGLMERRLGMVAEPYSTGRSGKYMRASKILTAAGAVGAVLAGRRRLPRAAAGAALLAASVATRWGVFNAGLASVDDPKYTIVPQRERLKRGEPARLDGKASSH